MRLGLCASTWLAIFSFSLAAVVPAQLEKRSLVEEHDSVYTHGPKTRALWNDGYSVSTNIDTQWPITGNTVTYNWEITNSTCDVDGSGGRVCFRINGQYPGPVLRASWGDTVVVNIKNSLQHNGTAVHWHGVRQYQSVGSDGVGGITECPVPPGDTRTYTFQVTQYGTSWYHSHFSAQYGDGVVGPIVFDGPASANYDLDLGPYMITEWYYLTAWQVNALSTAAMQVKGLPPHADTILVNGTDQSANGTGQYNQVTIIPGKKHRLRLVNIGTDNYVRVSLDNHVMQVMTSDFIPIDPFYTETLLMGPGQRYDVVIDANQTAGNYWFRAHVAGSCGSTNEHNGSAIWTYSGVQMGTPTSSSFDIPYDCIEPSANLVPIRNQPVPHESTADVFQDLELNFTKSVVVPGGDSVVVWALSATNIDISWEKPTLEYIMEGNTSYPIDLSILPTVSEGGWNYWVVQQVEGMPPVPHPIHLHGHDFFVLGQGFGQFNVNNATLNYATPPRRDTASVNGAGWLAVAFMSNNPGKTYSNRFFRHLLKLL